MHGVRTRLTRLTDTIDRHELFRNQLSDCYREQPVDKSSVHLLLFFFNPFIIAI